MTYEIKHNDKPLVSFRVDNNYYYFEYDLIAFL